MTSSAPKLTTEQRLQILEWFASGYSVQFVQVEMDKLGFPQISKRMLQRYRKRYDDKIAQMADDRLSSALKTGLALREERVARLKLHAERLELIKFIPGKDGKLHNERAWRETLDQIADEVGDKQGRFTGEVTFKFAASEE